MKSIDFYYIIKLLWEEIYSSYTNLKKENWEKGIREDVLFYIII